MIKSVLALFTFLLCFTTSAFPQFSIQLNPIGRYTTGLFAEGGSEIVAYDFLTRQIFSVNAGVNTLDIINISNPSAPTLVTTIDMNQYGGSANSVDVNLGLVAVAVENDNKVLPGKVVIFNSYGNYVNECTVGSLPDMVTFTSSGKYILVANEGEPNDDYSIDPEGSVSIIEVKLRGRILNVTNINFHQFNGQEQQLRNRGIRIYGPNANASQDFEPEYIAISDDDKLAYVTLQENNTVAVVNIKQKSIISLLPLGYKDYSSGQNKLDASDSGDTTNIANWPVYGMYQPDAISYFKSGNKGYLITANEGDARDYETFSEETRVRNASLDPTAFPNASELKLNQNLGRLNITKMLGDTDNDGDLDKLYTLGGRSFSIWKTNGDIVFDSGDQIEQITANTYPDNFNSDNEENETFDNRSDNKGPEPEAVAVAQILNRTFAFIGLERIGGVMVYDITNPHHPSFIQYINTRDFTGNPELGTAGDLGPECIVYIPFYKSPNWKPLLVVGNEVSGSVAIFEISLDCGFNKLYESQEEQIDVALLKEEIEMEEQKIIEAEVNENVLLQNYPNPFNPTTNITFSISKPEFVTLKVYDILGNEIATLLNDSVGKGIHQVKFDGSNLASGIYIYRLQAGNFVESKRLLLTK